MKGNISKRKNNVSDDLNRWVKRFQQLLADLPGMLAKKADKANKTGGFEGGENADGYIGGAVGKNAAVRVGGGFAGGSEANVNGNGVAAGSGARSEGGGAALGENTRARAGVAAGANARCERDESSPQGTIKMPIDAIQLGTGTNQNPKTVQAYTHQLMDANGNIPAERLRDKVLTKGNTQAFSPAKDYDPATKKYVDENKGLQTAVIKNPQDWDSMIAKPDWGGVEVVRIETTGIPSPPCTVPKNVIAVIGTDKMRSSILPSTGSPFKITGHYECKLENITADEIDGFLEVVNCHALSCDNCIYVHGSSMGSTNNCTVVGLDRGDVLTKDNTDYYEPMDDYNPATKAYVDNKDAGFVANDTFSNLVNNTIKVANPAGGFGGGANARANGGGAVGMNAVTESGFAGGADAKTVTSGGAEIDAIQLGTGTNSNSKTLQVYTHQLMDANGNVPKERLDKTVENGGILAVLAAAGFNANQVTLPANGSAWQKGMENGVRPYVKTKLGSAGSLSGGQPKDPKFGRGYIVDSAGNAYIAVRTAIPMSEWEDTLQIYGYTPKSTSEKAFIAVFPNSFGISGDPKYSNLAAWLKTLNDSVLTKDNTTAYTPSANYQPATKKYVDDKVASAGGGGGGGGGTPAPSYVKYDGYLDFGANSSSEWSQILQENDGEISSLPCDAYSMRIYDIFYRYAGFTPRMAKLYHYADDPGYETQQVTVTVGEEGFGKTLIRRKNGTNASWSAWA